MKKSLIFSLVSIAIIIFSFSIYYMVPKTITESIKGVEYQLGSKNHQINPVTIDINGEFHRSLFGSDTFVGTINIKNAHYPNPNKDRKTTIKFDKNGMGIISYAYFENGQPITYSYGALYTNQDFSKVTIEEFRKDQNGGRGWTGWEGWMATGPANTRSEALEISNELMKKIYK